MIRKITYLTAIFLLFVFLSPVHSAEKKYSRTVKKNTKNKNKSFIQNYLNQNVIKLENKGNLIYFETINDIFAKVKNRDGIEIETQKFVLKKGDKFYRKNTKFQKYEFKLISITNEGIGVKYKIESKRKSFGINEINIDEGEIFLKYR